MEREKKPFITKYQGDLQTPPNGTRVSVLHSQIQLDRDGTTILKWQQILVKHSYVAPFDGKLRDTVSRLQSNGKMWAQPPMLWNPPDLEGNTMQNETSDGSLKLAAEAASIAKSSTRMRRVAPSSKAVPVKPSPRPEVRMKDRRKKVQLSDFILFFQESSWHSSFTLQMCTAEFFMKCQTSVLLHCIFFLNTRTHICFSAIMNRYITLQAFNNV